MPDLLKEFNYLIGLLSTYSVIIPLSVSFYRQPQLKYLRILRVLLVVSGSCDLLSLLLYKFSMNNLWIGNVYRILEFALLALLYSEVLAISKKRYVQFATIAILSLGILNFLFIQGMYHPNSITKTVSGITLIIFALAYFYKLIDELSVDDLSRLPMFWINSAILFYFSGNLFLFVFDAFLFAQLPGKAGDFWILHNILNIAKNILFAIGLWIALQRPIYR